MFLFVSKYPDFGHFVSKLDGFGGILPMQIDWTILYTFCLDIMLVKKSGHHFFGHFVSKLGDFCVIFKSRYFGKG